MYCPNCGSNNQSETKYCTRCGTNLGIVSDALSGKLSEPSKSDERNVQLLTDYYRGRLSIFIGVISLVIAALILILIQSLEASGKLRFFNFLSIAGIIYGAIAIAWGVEKWTDSTGEIQALGYTPTEMKKMRSARADSVRLVPEAPKSEQTMSGTNGYSTDPIAMPSSITEQTTRELDEAARRFSLETRSKKPR